MLPLLIAPLRTVTAVLSLLTAATDSTPRLRAPTPVAIHFAARVARDPFVCGKEYLDLGKSQSGATASEFMMYVSEVRLLRADGSEIPVALTDDGTWQRNNTALVDFAAGGVGTDCTNASAETNTVLRGVVETPGDFTGIRFVLGVPFAQNHQDQATASAPFSSSRMFWSWNGGYKFVRLDLASSTRRGGWFVHLGSVACSPSGSPSTAPTACAQPNRPTITLTGFDPLKSPVIADVALLLSQSDLTATGGCMSNRASPGCPGVLRTFGVMSAPGADAVQSFFRIDK